MATVASVSEEMVTDTWGMWLKVRFPKVKLLAASPQLLIHPTRPASIKGI